MKRLEFAHIHPSDDGSLHICLLEPARTEAVAKGWTERHILMVSGGAPKSVVMVYGPRDEEKLEMTLRGSSRSQR